MGVSHIKTTSFEFLIIKNQRILRRVYIYSTDRGMIVLQLQHVLVYRPLSVPPMCRPYFISCLDRACYIFIICSVQFIYKKFIVHDIWTRT
jgi:hypothetical protein